ncbi:hypothetical protein ACOMHN_001466 [Nucella lapillus]
MLFRIRSGKAFALACVGSVVLMVILKITMTSPSNFQIQLLWSARSPNAAQPTVKTTTVTTAPAAPLLTDQKAQQNAGKTLLNMLYRSPVEYHCKNQDYVKNKGGGARKVCTDQNFNVKRPCLVYSFGVNYDFTFEDTFGKMGCEVFSFDPSMTTKNHRRSPEVMFYRIGLGKNDSDTFEPRMDIYVREKTFWKMRTLKSLISMLNHNGRTIDVVKMDIECYEWDIVRDCLDSGAFRQVKQFLVEWHIFPDCPGRQSFQQLIQLLKDLHQYGFHNFVTLPNGNDPNWASFRIQSEIGYINTRFLNKTGTKA